uniref:Uncharacterized protein n=1 Tax=Gracilariopsis andersonii TaxID=172979 RepID=E5Q3D8_9FLOR|nr:hypothetical protein GAND_26 [Gracilariopsis andersonii]ADR03221.1 hypothetical protein GAND_26 [Gracilariopsis andersonii]
MIKKKIINFPLFLGSCNQFCLWKYKKIDKRLTKKPYCINLQTNSGVPLLKNSKNWISMENLNTFLLQNPKISNNYGLKATFFLSLI